MNRGSPHIDCRAALDGLRPHLSSACSALLFFCFASTPERCFPILPMAPFTVLLMSFKPERAGPTFAASGCLLSRSGAGYFDVPTFARLRFRALHHSGPYQ